VFDARLMPDVSAKQEQEIMAGPYTPSHSIFEELNWTPVTGFRDNCRWSQG